MGSRRYHFSRNQTPLEGAWSQRRVLNLNQVCFFDNCHPPPPEGAWSQRRAFQFQQNTFPRILTPWREPGNKGALQISKRVHVWEFWPPGGSLVTKKGFKFQKTCFFRIPTPWREPGRWMNDFWGILGPYGSIWAEILWKCIVYQLSSYWNPFWTNFRTGIIKHHIQLSKTNKFDKCCYSGDPL